MVHKMMSAVAATGLLLAATGFAAEIKADAAADATVSKNATQPSAAADPSTTLMDDGGVKMDAAMPVSPAVVTASSTTAPEHKIESGASAVKVEKIAGGAVVASATVAVSGSVSAPVTEAKDAAMGGGEKLDDYMKDAAQPTDDAGDKVMGSGGSGVGSPADIPPPPEGDDMMGSDTPGSLDQQ